MNINTSVFGNLSNQSRIDKIDLINKNNIKVSILTYGGIIQSIETPNEKGILKDIVLGYDDMDGYINDPYYIGAIIGPVAGRISNAQIPLNGNIIQLDANAGNNQLHGGPDGLNTKIWNAKTETLQNSVKLELKCFAKDGESGYPGNREFTTTYILNNKNQLLIYFDAVSDKDTVVNMTSHSYFNLSDKENDGIDEHLVMINSLKTLATNKELMPNGEFEYILGKPTNFSRGKSLKNALMEQAEGFDHLYIINKEEGKFSITAKVVHQESGRVIELYTDQPGLVFYTNNAADGKIIGKNNHPIIKQGAFCLEPQKFTDAPNHPNFPSIVLKANQKYSSRNQFNFGLASDTHH